MAGWCCEWPLSGITTHNINKNQSLKDPVKTQKPRAHLKAITFVTKWTIKKKTSHRSNSSQPVILVHSGCLNPLFLNQHSFILLPFCFQSSSQDQQNGKHSSFIPLVLQDYPPDTSYHVSAGSLVLYWSPEILLNFITNLYIRLWLGKFKVFRLLENSFASQKN